MNMNPFNPPASPPRQAAGLQRVLQGLLRLGAGIVAFVLMLGALGLGLILALGLVTWALVRGRKPGLGVFRTTYHRARQTRYQTPQSGGNVVDVEVREVQEVRDRREQGLG